MKIGSFKTVYSESKKKDNHGMISDDHSWAQTVRILFKDFPEIKKEKIGDDIEIVIAGPVSNMDEKGASLKIVRIAMAEKIESGDKIDKSIDNTINNNDTIKDKKKKAGKLGKIFGDK